MNDMLFAFYVFTFAIYGVLVVRFVRSRASNMHDFIYSDVVNYVLASIVIIGGVALFLASLVFAIMRRS